MENIQRAYSKIKHKYTKYTGRLGSGSVRFWLPGSGSKGEKQQKMKQKNFSLKPPNLNC